MEERQLLSGRKHAPAHLGDVLILGTGKSGKASAEYLAEQPAGRIASLTVAAGASTPAALEWAESFEATYPDCPVTIYFDNEQVEGAFDLCIASPGIPQFGDFYENGARASREIISEVEFAWRESAADARWVAITGTNGKTTTTALTAHILEQAGLAAHSVGNIGYACIEAVGLGTTDVYVAETSSYQLASTALFAPDVAVVLNITPDHLAWHTSHERYAEAKWKVLANIAHDPAAVAVLGAVNDEVRAKVREIKAAQASDPARTVTYVPIGTARGLAHDMRRACGAANAAFVTEEGMLHVALRDIDVDLLPVSDLQIPGEHNAENALAAATCALALGVAPDAVASGLATFAPLEHRIEPAGTVGGVRCYNDSKATNVDATLVALKAFLPERPIVLLGGRDKGTDLDPLVDACIEYVDGVVCYGESKERFLEAFSADRVRTSDLAVWEAGGMEDALDVALSHAPSNGIVLLSPACASFDEFTCYEERGEVFKRLVAQRDAASETEA